MTEAEAQDTPNLEPPDGSIAKTRGFDWAPIDAFRKPDDDPIYWDETYRRFEQAYWGEPFVLYWPSRTYHFRNPDNRERVLLMWMRLIWEGSHPNACRLEFGDCTAGHAVGFFNPNRDQFIHNTAIYRMRFHGGGEDGIPGDCIHCDHATGELTVLMHHCFVAGFPHGAGIWLGEMTRERTDRLGYARAGHSGSTPCMIGDNSIFYCGWAINIASASQTGVNIGSISGDNHRDGFMRLTVGRNNAIYCRGAHKAEMADHPSVGSTLFKVRKAVGGYCDLGACELLLRKTGMTLIDIEGEVPNNVDWKAIVVRPGFQMTLDDLVPRGVVVNGSETIKVRDLLGRPRWQFPQL